MPPRKNFAALAALRNASAAAASGSQPALKPAATGPAAPAPPDSADEAKKRLKDRAAIRTAFSFQPWYEAAFFDEPTGALKEFINRLEQGVADGRFTLGEVQEYIGNPRNQQGILLLLSLSVPGQRVYADELDTFQPETVIEKYMQKVYKEAGGDLDRLKNLSLTGKPAPVRAPVRRAPRAPSAALRPTSPAASLQGPTKRPGLAFFNEMNAARQQESADLAADRSGEARKALAPSIVADANATLWQDLSENEKRIWDR